MGDQPWQMEETVRTTLPLDRRILRAMRMLAEQRNTTLKALVNEALREWLLQQEDEEEREADEAALTEALEARARGERGVSWEELKARLDELWAQEEAGEETDTVANR